MERVTRQSIRLAWLLALLFLFGAPLSAGEDDFLRPIGKPLEAKAQRRQGGEALPPLPLPVTPLRRSEKKRPPSPTALIGKVIWGGFLDFTHEDGTTERVFDWNMVPAEAQQLLNAVKRAMKLEYTWQATDLGTFSGSPAELPLLYFSGGRHISFTPEERAKLRRYLLSGGTVLMDAVAGSPYFFESALQEARAILPESPVQLVSDDHALYRMVVQKTTVKINGKAAQPNFYGVYVGPRLAIIVCPFGLGAGWDNASPTLIAEAKTVDAQDAQALGLNIVAYVIGWFETGQAIASGALRDKPAADSPDHIRFALLKTQGLWNATPGAEARLMAFLARNNRLDAETAPVHVDPAAAALDAYPFLVLNGLGDFKLDGAAVENLRRYLDNGGFLVLNNVLGMNPFDAAALRLAAALAPDQKLEKIPLSDDLYANGPYHFNGSGFSDAAAVKYPDQDGPLLYGLRSRQGDRWTLIYSPVDMAGGWLGTDQPGSVAYDASTALRLGADILFYCLTR